MYLSAILVIKFEVILMHETASIVARLGYESLMYKIGVEAIQVKVFIGVLTHRNVITVGNASTSLVNIDSR